MGRGGEGFETLTTDVLILVFARDLFTEGAQSADACRTVVGPPYVRDAVGSPGPRYERPYLVCYTLELSF